MIAQSYLDTCLSGGMFYYLDVPVYEGIFYLTSIVYITKINDDIICKDSQGYYVSIKLIDADTLQKIVEQIQCYKN